MLSPCCHALVEVEIDMYYSCTNCGRVCEILLTQLKEKDDDEPRCCYDDKEDVDGS